MRGIMREINKKKLANIDSGCQFEIDQCWYMIEVNENKKLREEAGLSKATKGDYVRWLVKYLEQGGEITHYYDYDFPASKWRIAYGPTKLPELCGALSINILYNGPLSDIDAPGHSNVYSTRDYATNDGFVPCYNDIASIIEAGVFNPGI